MNETAIVYIAMEKDMQGILPADSIRHNSAKDCVIRRAMNYVQRKWSAPPVKEELLDLYNRRKAPFDI